ncbi:MFS transporter [Streptomyces sp. J2-1]|uniref:MFS transporter n=1 Tax=Streptomyces corallincola TaxID=2851888 RepID=UPI001C3829FE|nr:MFS transporter [Streptomyces corallincola]MBV2357616.1 MFS transporter [Streptomyces corallincola]
MVLLFRAVPLVLVLLAGGVISDRLGSRWAMLTADMVRCATQAGLAVLLLSSDVPALWALMALVATWGAAEALFTPALDALVPTLTGAETLSDANALLGVTRSAVSVAGPALAGGLTALVGAVSVLALDSASYAVSAVALLLLPRTTVSVRRDSSFVGDLREGWSEFRSRTWLWVGSLRGCLFNLLVWAPFLVLGPVVAARRLGGAASWGVVMAAYGVGAVVGGLAVLGRHPRRPLLVAAWAALGWALPSAALSLRLPVLWLCGAALVAGVGSAVSGTYYAAVTQREIPPGALARVSACNYFGAFVLGPVGLAVAGPVSALVGAEGVLGFGAVWQLGACAVVVAVPALRRVAPRPGGVGAREGGGTGAGGGMVTSWRRRPAG